MGLRFFRRVNLIPGLRLNFSRSGISASLGHRGFWYTIGRRNRRVTLGLPGTGLFYTQVVPWRQWIDDGDTLLHRHPNHRDHALFLLILAAVVVGLWWWLR